jgi:hypothetical protein
MVAYSFNKRFVLPIENRTKTHTIRAYRKGNSRHARPGETLQLYTALRTRHTRLIGLAECLDIYDIEIHLGGSVTFPDTGLKGYCGDRLDLFAQLDGFENWRDFYDFWRREHRKVSKFNGVLIEWGQSFVPVKAA